MCFIIAVDIARVVFNHVAFQYLCVYKYALYFLANFVQNQAKMNDVANIESAWKSYMKKLLKEAFTVCFALRTLVFMHEPFSAFALSSFCSCALCNNSILLHF